MAAAMRQRLADAGGAYAATFRSPALRRAQMAFGAAWTAEWAFTVALGVVAYREGGAAAVGFVALLRTLPAALASPFLSAMADRVRRDRVLVATSLARAAATGGVAVVLQADAAIWLAYGLAVVSTVAFTPFRAAHSALLPSLCTTPQQLTASNVVRGSLDSISLLLGPLASAVILAAWSPSAVFAAAAGLALWSAWLMHRLDYEPAPRTCPLGQRRIVAETVEGLKAVAREPDLRRVIGLFLAQTFTRGCLTVFTVVVAIDLLGMGEPGVGVLTAALGAGAVAGSVGASMMVALHRLAAATGLSVALWGAPLVLMAAFPEKAPVLAALAVIGMANAVLDASGFTLMARLTPDEMLGRVFGLFESLIAVSVAAGAILTPVAIDVVGVRGALLAAGLVGPGSALLAWRRLRRLDDRMTVRDADIRLLQRVAMLRPLPVTTIERIAHNAHRMSLPAGAEIIRQGDEGDRYYVIEDGQVEVTQDGSHLRLMGAGEGFGEIALLRTTVRTTTVTSTTGVRLLAMDRDDFVPPVTGFSASAATAAQVVQERLARRPAADGVRP